MAKKILLVEDEKDVSDLVRAFLEHNKFEVLTAYDGAEALEKAKEKPDLIILDLMLPKIHGKDVLNRLKYDRETENIPVIVLTGRSESRMIFEVMELGSFDYLVKPYDNKELLKAILRALNMTNE